MVLSYYLYRFPYSIIWYLKNLLNRLEPFVFYCGDPLDYYVFAPVAKYLGNINYVTDKKSVKAFFNEKEIPYKSMPVFPSVVIMARHSTHKFPCNSIIKIGMRHGAYHFKRMTSAANYNQFDLYLMTSQSDVETGLKLGVKSAKAIGFPKMDPCFDDTISIITLKNLSKKLNLSPDKPVVLFTSTYDASGMSAIDLWYDKLSELIDRFNVLVTTHHWISRKYKEKLKTTVDIHVIEDYDILPYIKLADVVVGDTSSILAECCALDKPIVTFNTARASRSFDEIDGIIESISYRINKFSELLEKLDYVITHKEDLAEARAKANVIFFDTLDGKASERAAKEIKRILKMGD